MSKPNMWTDFLTGRRTMFRLPQNRRFNSCDRRTDYICLRVNTIRRVIRELRIVSCMFRWFNPAYFYIVHVYTRTRMYYVVVVKHSSAGLMFLYTALIAGTAELISAEFL